jgi:putative PIN family toxin of toxin-antitoxin system
MSLSRRSAYYPVWSALRQGKYDLCITNEIIEEYEEILTQKMSKDIATNVINAILDFPNVHKTEIFFHFGLIQEDYDDNKFVDCAIKANARFIVSQDHHFDILKTIPFPKVDVISIDDFIKTL